MATISGDALWYIIRKDSSFARRNRAYGGQNFSVDPFAVNGMNHKRTSIAADKAVGVSLNKDGQLVVRVKTSNTKPAGVTKVVKRAGFNSKATIVAQVCFAFLLLQSYHTFF